MQNNGGSPHYDIYIFNLEPGYYGYAQGESYSQNNTIINHEIDIEYPGNREDLIRCTIK